MRVGLLGAQRVGKTTLAQKYCELHNVPFVQTQIRQAYKAIGMDLRAEYDARTRLAVQWKLLEWHLPMWKQDGVFDRTPLDLLSYMDADMLRTCPSDDEFVADYSRYRETCFSAAKTFDLIVLIQPGIKIIDDPETTQGALPYMEHLNSLMLGYLSELSFSGYWCNYAIMDRLVLDFDERLAELDSFING